MNFNENLVNTQSFITNYCTTEMHDEAYEQKLTGIVQTPKILNNASNENSMDWMEPNCTKYIKTEPGFDFPLLNTFDTPEEELKVLQFLESGAKPQNQNKRTGDDLQKSTYRVKCYNCNILFDHVDFQTHVCEYDENNIHIHEATTTDPPEKIVKKEKPIELACIRLMRDNQIRLRRIIKDDLKYDIDTQVLHTANVNPNTKDGNGKKSEYECTLCERRFVHPSGLQRHMEKHLFDQLPPINCNNTGDANKAPSSISAHAMIECVRCGQIFNHPKQAHQHLYVHYSAFAYKDIQNPKIDEPKKETSIEMTAAEDYTVEGSAKQMKEKYITTQRIINYSDYLKGVSVKVILQCEFCNLIFQNSSYLFSHAAFHTSLQQRYECHLCSINVNSSRDITLHWQSECVFMRENIKMYHSTIHSWFACNVCETKFQTRDQLLEHRHRKLHFFPRIDPKTKKFLLPCECCEMVFSDIVTYYYHFDRKHQKKIKKDREVDKSLYKTRQFLCDICGKAYTQSSHLWQHLRFHQGVKPFECPEENCGRKFTIRPDLNDHIRKCHTGERPFKCVECGKSFMTGSVYYQHRLIHRGERRYECEECGKRFYRADALKNHQRIHTGEKPFPCLYCTKHFRQRGDRDKHIKARHSHLDANTRFMMQMQKLQLESAAAATAEATAASIVQNITGTGMHNELYVIVDNDEEAKRKKDAAQSLLTCATD